MTEIDISDLRKITRLLKDKYNYDFTNYAMSSFKRRIVRLVELYKFKSVDFLLDKLESEPGFLEEFLSEITVNVTEMFRDPSFWKVLKDDIIPSIYNTHSKISIWHAGCSSGEEAYSMAILLDQMGILSNAKIVATDIDAAILSRAKQGVISLKNMELNNKNFETAIGSQNLKNYYTEVGSEGHISKDIINSISFRRHDLVKGAPFSKFDLVMCRNVMIYFNQTLQNDVLHKLHGSLFKYGHLAIGAKESLIWCDISNKFVVVNNEEKIYKKVKD